MIFDKTELPTGVILGEPSAAYHACAAVSSTKLTDIYPCPRYFFQKHIEKSIVEKKSASLDFGIAAHAAILEGPEAFAKCAIVRPYTYPSENVKTGAVTQKPWTLQSKYCAEWESAEEGKGMIVLSPAEAKTIAAIEDEIARLPDVMALLKGGTPEATFRQRIGNIYMQCRADKWHHDGITLPSGEVFARPLIVDLKTCDSIEAFKSHYFDLRYYYRAAFYIDVAHGTLAEAAGVDRREIDAPEFIFVAAEKKPPYRVEIFRPDPLDLEDGKQSVMADWRTLLRCFRENVWPCSNTTIQTLSLKRWQREKHELPEAI